MELVFITRAIRRYWWAVVIGGLLGLVGGYATMSGGPDMYEANALILVSPVTEWGASATSTDRFVQNQVSLLSSSTLAEQVASELEIDESVVVRSTVFEQVIGTDVIRVSVRADEPELAQDIANLYVDAYLESVRAQAVEARKPDLEDIDSRLVALEGQISEIDAAIRQAMQPYLPGGQIAGPDPQIVPSISEIEPALATRREVAIQQYSDLVAQRNSMEVGGAQARSGTQVWQRAALPPVAESADRLLVLIAGPIVGAMLGALAAIALARSSDRVLDADEVHEVLARPVAGRVALRTVDAAALLTTHVPSDLTEVTHHLCVRAEASGTTGRALVVVVAGAERSAGTDVLAAAMSRHFADAGARVVMLAAANPGSASMSAKLGEEDNNLDRLVRLDQSPGVAARAADPLEMIEVGDPFVRFAGPGSGPGEAGLRHQDVGSLVSAAGKQVDVVVVDAGHLMGSAASVRLAQEADVVVLAVPLTRQHRDALAEVARQVRDLTTVLPVLTKVRSRWSTADASTSAASAAGAAADRRPAPSGAAASTRSRGREPSSRTR